MARAATTADAFNAVGEPQRRAILDVLGALQVPEEREDPASLVQSTTLEMDLDRPLEQAEQHTARPRLLLGRIRDCSEQLVPAAKHVERVGHLGERPPLVGTVPDLPRQLEHAESLAEGGQAGEAAPLLAEARETFERLGAVPWLERLAAVSGEREAVAG